MARALKHYLVGFDRPTPGQVKTIWPSEEIFNVPGANTQLTNFATRGSAKTKNSAIGKVRYHVEPWQGLVMIGRFETIHDGTVPAREVEHVHAILVNPNIEPNWTITPLDMTEVFVTPQDYRNLSTLNSEFYREISIKLKFNSPIGAHSVGSTNLGPSLTEFTRTVAQLSENLSFNRVTETLARLPLPLRSRVQWGFTSERSPLTKDSSSASSNSTSENNESSQPTIDDSTVSLATLIFDLIFPNITVEKAYEIAINTEAELSSTDENQTKSTLVVQRLIGLGLSPDRLARALCENYVSTYQNFQIIWTETLIAWLTELYSDRWPDNVFRLGFPYLAKLLSKAEVDQYFVDHNNVHRTLLETAKLDSSYRDFTEKLSQPREYTVIKLIQESTDIAVDHIDSLCRSYDSKQMAKIFRLASLEPTARAASSWEAILKITTVLDNGDRSDLSNWWHETIQYAASTNRSLFNLLTLGNSELAKHALKNYDQSIIKLIKRTIAEFESNGSMDAPTNLNNLSRLLEHRI